MPMDGHLLHTCLFLYGIGVKTCNKCTRSINNSNVFTETLVRQDILFAAKFIKAWTARFRLIRTEIGRKKRHSYI